MGEPGDKPKPPAKVVDGATDKVNPFKLKRILLKVSVRSDFLTREPFLVNKNAKDGVEFHWEGEAVANATVTLPNVTPVTTDRSGVAKLDITTLADGTHNLTIDMLTPAAASTNAAAGPALARGLATPPSRIYRPLVVSIKLEGGKLKGAVDPYDADKGATWGRIGNRNQKKISEDHLPVDWRPVWLKSPREKAARAASKVNLVICHCTCSAIVNSAIEEFKSAGVEGAHYLIDQDGHIVKLAREDHETNHSGKSPGDTKGGVVWHGLRHVNPISIGIEMAHEAQGNALAGFPYHDHQIKSLISLLKALQADTALSIPKHRVVGHADVDFTHNVNGGSLGSRDTDPGQVFPWETLEAAGVGMIPQAAPDMSKAYGGFFAQVPGGVLAPGDSDAKKTWGGKAQKPYDDKTSLGMPVPGSAVAIKELQEDLHHIGYTAKEDDYSNAGDRPNVSDKPGVYSAYTQFQVRKFQWHFFSGSRKKAANGRVDLDTATMIKRVKAGIPGTP